MKSRPYLNCPLEAQLAAKNFGVKFESWDKRPLSYTKGMFHFKLKDKEWFPYAGKLYFLEEDLLKLEPIVGDLLQSSKGTMGGVSVGYLLEKRFRLNKPGSPENKDYWTLVPRFGDNSRVDAHWITPKEWHIYTTEEIKEELKYGVCADLYHKDEPTAVRIYKRAEIICQLLKELGKSK